MAILDAQTASKFGYNNMKNRVVRNVGKPIQGTDAQTFASASYTTAERDAIVTKVAGMMVWNSTTTKLQVWTGGAWADLH